MISLLKVDELIRKSHSYLTPHDECFYFHDYTPYKNASFSHGNQLILNFKKKMDRKGYSDWKYKGEAIRKVANMLDQAPLPFNKADTILVPIPPSKIKGHPLYDDRMLQVLQAYCHMNSSAETREILSYIDNLEASHESGNRPTPKMIFDNLDIDEDLCVVNKTTLVLVDDVITTSAHFIACQQKLRLHFPDATIMGIFIARRIINSSE